MSSEGQKDPLYRVKVADSITDLIGVTPCVRLGRLGRYDLEEIVIYRIKYFLML
jgi:hypothetical protein